MLRDTCLTECQVCEDINEHLMGDHVEEEQSTSTDDDEDPSAPCLAKCSASSPPATGAPPLAGPAPSSGAPPPVDGKPHKVTHFISSYMSAPAADLRK